MERAFEPVAPRACETLSWVRELQRIEVALQNNLARDPEAVHMSLIQAMLADNSSFVKFRKSTAIFTNLWERYPSRSCMSSSQLSLNQMFISQLTVARVTTLQDFQGGILIVLLECLNQIQCSFRSSQMDIMNQI
jgi:hypothetical protein